MAHFCPACTVSVGVALFLIVVFKPSAYSGHLKDSATQQCDFIVDCSLCAPVRGTKMKGTSARVMGLCNE